MSEQKTQAAAIQAELEAIEAEITTVEQSSRETLARIRAELLRQSRLLADAHIDLAAQRAWRGDTQK